MRDSTPTLLVAHLSCSTKYAVRSCSALGRRDARACKLLGASAGLQEGSCPGRVLCVWFPLMSTLAPWQRMTGHRAAQAFERISQSVVGCRCCSLAKSDTGMCVRDIRPDYCSYACFAQSSLIVLYWQENAAGRVFPFLQADRLPLRLCKGPGPRLDATSKITMLQPHSDRLVCYSD